ncbi:MAG: 30S ribosomal protein S6 [Alphaproteobacteria bacterium]
MAFYECIFLARPEISTAQVEAHTEAFSNLIIDAGGEVQKTEFWGLKTLAYRVKKNRKAHYVMLNLISSKEAIDEMRRLMSLNEDIMRDLTTRVDAFEDGPSIMMRKVKEREERNAQEGGRYASGRAPING